MNKALFVIGTVMVAVVLGSTATTAARWNDEVQLTSALVQSGTLSLLGGNATTQVSSYSFTELAATNMAPGAAAQAPLVLRNDGDVDLTYRLVQASPTVGSDLGPYLSISMGTVAAASDCPAGPGHHQTAAAETVLYSGPPGTGLTGPSQALPVGATEALCAQVSLEDAAPPTVQAASSTITFTFRAEMTS